MTTNDLHIVTCIGPITDNDYTLINYLVDMSVPQRLNKLVMAERLFCGPNIGGRQTQ